MGAIVTGNLTVTVVAAMMPDGTLDSHGYGFSDAIWAACGGDPFGAGVFAPAAQALTLSKLGIKLNFAKPTGNDAIQLSGTLPIPKGFVSKGQQVILDIGGVVKIFALDAKGGCKNSAGTFKLAFKSTKGAVAAQTAKFSANLSKGTFAAALATQGLANADANKASHAVSVGVYFNQQIFEKSQTVHYSAKKGKSGSAK